MRGISFDIVIGYFVLAALLLVGTGLVLFLPSKKRAAKNVSAGDISEQKKKVSKLCLAGLIISALYPVLMAVTYFVFQSLHFPYDDINEYVRLTMRAADIEENIYGVLFFLPIIGIIVSIIGLVNAGKKNTTGKKYAIAGIILPFGYLTIVILIAVFGFIMLLVENSQYSRNQPNDEVNDMGYVGNLQNTEYDVSPYRIPDGFDFDTLNVNTSEAELKVYAESKLDKIIFVKDKSAKGEFQGSRFIIVRTDCFDEWSKFGTKNSFNFSKGYATLYYDYSWEFAAHATYALDVYKDPSDKYIIITNCGDYKVVAEFFEGIGNPVPTESSDEPEETRNPRETNETKDPVTLRNYGMKYYLEHHIYEETLPEIIKVFKQLCSEQPLDNEKIICRYGYVQDTCFCFGFAREYKAEDGKTYQIWIEAIYGLTVRSRSFELTEVNSNDVDGDFYEYITNTEAYKYAITAKIKIISVYWVEVNA